MPSHSLCLSSRYDVHGVVLGWSQKCFWRLALLAVGFSLVGWAHAHEVGLRVLTFNIHHGEGTDGKVDLKRTADAILAASPDIVALQEVDRGARRTEGVDQVEQLANLIGGWYGVFGAAMPFEGGQYGNAILSRFPLTEVDPYALPFREDQEPRCALFATVTPNNGLPSFRFVSTHLSHDVEAVRLEQVQHLIGLVERETRPVIVAGDFNARPGSAPMKVLWEKDWVDHVEPGSVIDYVLTRERDSWGRESSETVEDRVTSDHRPVRVSLKWNGGRQPRTAAAGFPGTLVVLGNGVDPESPILSRSLWEVLGDGSVGRWYLEGVSLDELQIAQALLESGGSAVVKGKFQPLVPGLHFLVEEDGVLVVRGRRAWALGEGLVQVLLPSSPTGRAESITLSEQQPVDLTALRRTTVERERGPFPSDPAVQSQLGDGTLILVGGGGVPDQVIDTFINAAGGEEARIAIIPISSPEPQLGVHWLERAGRERGVRQFKVLEGRTPEAVDGSESLAFLREATGIWFGGGRQWRFIDAYEDTLAHRALQGVLERGGVIGGTSAGASIQAEYMARGNPLGSRDIMAEGYERGLGFLPGAAVDQHFTQRNRFPDMTSLLETYPQLLGIGLDEATALIVRGSVGEVMGRGAVHFYDRRKPVPSEGHDYETVPAGQAFDLVERRILKRPQ